MGYPHPDLMLAGLTSRQLTEMYAFARLEPLDEPMQRMLAQLASVIARVNGNEHTTEDFMLKPKPAEDDRKVRAAQITEMFQRAAAMNQR